MQKGRARKVELEEKQQGIEGVNETVQKKKKYEKNLMGEKGTYN